MAENSEGLAVAVLASAVRMNDRYPGKYNRITFFPHLPSLNEGWRTAKPGSEHMIKPMTRRQIYTHDLPSQGQGVGANAVQA